MNFYLVFTKNRKKFDKYVKVNRIKNKVIIDIKQQLEEYDISYLEYKEYFNLLIYTKITHSLHKKKDIYYLPNFSNESLDVEEIFKIKKILDDKSNFNILIFYDEFKDNDEVNQSILNNMSIFNASQILKSY
jgi:hypothetical protein